MSVLCLPLTLRIVKVSAYVLVAPQRCCPIRERSFWLLGIYASLRGEELSGSLLGTWAHFANGSSRSRLCRTWLRNAGSSPVGGTFGGQETCSVQTCDEFLKFQVRSTPKNQLQPEVLPHTVQT